MKKVFSVKCSVFSLIVAAAVAAGCSSTPSLLQHPATSHVVQVTGKVINAGVVEDPVTGQNSVGYKTGYLTVTTIPVSIYADSNGVAHYLVPDVAESYEVLGKGMLFGSAGSVYTLATGDGVNTLLGGNHVPANMGFYGSNNLMTYGAPAAISNPVATTTGTNGTVTPIVIKP